MSYLGNTSWTQYSNIKGDYNIHVYDYNRNSFYRDGVLAGTGPESTLTAPYSMYLYTKQASEGTTGGSAEHFKGKMYYCNIWDDDVLVREFIPVKNNSDVYGFYDCVNRVFYPSATSSYSFTGA